MIDFENTTPEQPAAEPYNPGHNPEVKQGPSEARGGREFILINCTHELLKVQYVDDQDGPEDFLRPDEVDSWCQGDAQRYSFEVMMYLSKLGYEAQVGRTVDEAVTAATRAIRKEVQRLFPKNRELTTVVKGMDATLTAMSSVKSLVALHGAVRGPNTGLRELALAFAAAQGMNIEAFEEDV